MPFNKPGHVTNLKKFTNIISTRLPFHVEADSGDSANSDGSGSGESVVNFVISDASQISNNQLSLNIV